MSDPADRVYATLVDRQIARNRHQDRDWALFSPHRARLHALIEEALPAGGRVCVLGAGNGNDLELAGLASRVAELHLVDLDAAALGRGLSHVPEDARQRVVLHAPVDLTGGLLPVAARWRQRAPNAATLSGQVGPATTKALEPLPGGFDLVVSDCLLSQMCLAAAEAVGPHGPLAEDVCRVLGRIHLRTMTRLLRPGGSALFACDLTSTSIVPELGPWEEGGLGELEILMREVAEARRHSVGMNPFLLRRMFREDDELRAAVADSPRLRAPWLWRVSDDDVFLVFAMSWARRAEPG